MDLPRDKKIVGYKRVFIVKCKADGFMKRYKVRVVANDFIQTCGIDHLKTFAHIAKINPIQVETFAHIAKINPIQGFYKN